PGDLCALGRLLRRVLRKGAEGPHADQGRVRPRVREGGRARHADFADGRVPDRSEGERPAVDVLERHLHAAREHFGTAGNIGAVRPQRGTSGRLAGHREQLPGAHHVPRRGGVRARHSAPPRTTEGESRMKATRRSLTNAKVERIPASGILVTVGVSEAVDLALRATLNDGDEVIIADPSYVAYVPGIVLAGGVPVPVATDERHDFRLRPEDVEGAITSRTRAILIGFPNNPTGAVLTEDDLKGLARLAEEHDLLIYSDEIYDRLVYGVRHRSIIEFPGMRDRTIYLAGFSKSYAMTGWRVGYACAPA